MPHGISKGARVALRGKQAGFSVDDDFGDAAHVCGNDGHAMREGFHDHVGDAVAIAVGMNNARHDEHVVVEHVTADLVVRDKAGHVNDIFKAQPVAHTHELEPPAPVAHEGQAHRHVFSLQARHGGEQVGKTLGARKAPHRQQAVRGAHADRALPLGGKCKAVVNGVHLIFLPGRAELAQPAHIGVVVGADEERICGFFPQQAVLWVDVASAARKGKGNAREARSHP